MQKSGTAGQSGQSGEDSKNLKDIIEQLRNLKFSYDFSEWSRDREGEFYGFKEIQKLHSMLEKANIPHSFGTHLYGLGYKLCYPSECNVILSAIEIPGSYGVEDDLIEIRGLFDRSAEDDNVLGYQTAQQVFDLIFEHYNSETVDLRDYLDEAGDLPF